MRLSYSPGHRATPLTRCWGLHIHQQQQQQQRVNWRLKIKSGAVRYSSGASDTISPHLSRHAGFSFLWASWLYSSGHWILKLWHHMTGDDEMTPALTLKTFWNFFFLLQQRSHTHTNPQWCAHIHKCTSSLRSFYWPFVELSGLPSEVFFVPGPGIVPAFFSTSTDAFIICFSIFL